MEPKTLTTGVASPKDEKGSHAAHVKIEKALEIRKSSSKAREGKPLAFPTHRMTG